MTIKPLEDEEGGGGRGQMVSTKHELWPYYHGYIVSLIYNYVKSIKFIKMKIVELLSWVMAGRL